MSNKRFSQEEHRRLRVALLQTPSTVQGPHLTDHQFVFFAQEALEGAELQATERHLQSCPDCCAELEDVLNAAGPALDFGIAGLGGHQAPAKVSVAARAAGSAVIPPLVGPSVTLGEKVSAAVAWLKALKIAPNLQPGLVMAASLADEVADSVSYKERVTISGELLVTFVSSLSALDGAEIVLRGGTSLRLENIGAGEYRGEALVSADEWARIGSGSLIAEIKLAEVPRIDA